METTKTTMSVHARISVVEHFLALHVLGELVTFLDNIQKDCNYIDISDNDSPQCLLDEEGEWYYMDGDCWESWTPTSNQKENNLIYIGDFEEYLEPSKKDNNEEQKIVYLCLDNSAAFPNWNKVELDHKTNEYLVYRELDTEHSALQFVTRAAYPHIAICNDVPEELKLTLIARQLEKDLGRVYENTASISFNKIANELAELGWVKGE